jgi:hypothetical protein
MKEQRPQDHALLRQKAKELSDGLYPTIGEFAVSFEAISHAIRMGIGILLAKNGLKNDRLSDILVGDLTMQPLQAAYRSLLAATEPLDPTAVAILDDLFKRVCQMAEHRNRILHSAWFIDFKNPDDLKNGLLLSYKPGRTKKGAKDCPSRVAMQEIKDITTEARVVGDLIHEVNMCVYTSTKIARRFKLSEEGRASATGTIGDYFKKKTE